MLANASLTQAQLRQSAASLSNSTDSSIISSSSSSDGSSAEVDELPGSLLRREDSSSDATEYSQSGRSSPDKLVGDVKRRRHKSRQERTSNLILSKQSTPAAPR